MVDRLPRTVLRTEGLAVAAGALILYFHLDFPWWLLVGLALAPDLSLLPLIASKRVGAITYDTVHNSAVPAALGVSGIVAEIELLVQIGLIFAAHVGLDRLVGFGLRYRMGFEGTHIQRV